MWRIKLSVISIRLPGYFKDNMVLQQGVTNRIFGQTKPNAKIEALLERYPGIDSAKTKEYGIVFQSTEESDARGLFGFRLPVLEASYDFYRLSLTVENTRCSIENIYFGEVWLALGESNMSMPVRYTDVEDLLPQISKQQKIRIFTMAEYGLSADEDMFLFMPTARIINGQWLTPDTENLLDVSATALVFAARLQESLNVPVAIYDLAAADTMIHSWLPREIIETKPHLKQHVQDVEHYRDKSNWNDLLSSEATSFSRKNQPTVMYNHKLAPFTSLSIRGVLFSHGESDVHYPEYYLEAFKEFSVVLCRNFHSFKRGPCMIYSQLAPYYYSSNDDKILAYFNEILTIARRQLKTPAGMITLYDLPLDYNTEGDNIYARPLNPRAKAQIGERMCAIAKGLVYHADMPTSAPEVKYAEWISDKLILSFANVGEGLKLPEGDLTLKGFNICGETSNYLPAHANKLFGIRTLVWHPEIKKPQSCSYAFSSFNQAANLLGGDGMPVVPFRLERDYPENSLSQIWMYCDQLTGWIVPKKEMNYVEMMKEDRPGYFPLWQIYSGKGKLSLEKNNKRSSSAALYLEYTKANEKPIMFEPILHYASLYPPLNLSFWHRLTIELFNSDHHVKKIFLLLEDESGNSARSVPHQIKDVLAWQKISFIIDEMPVDLSKIKRLQFILQSNHSDGNLTIDSVFGEGRKIIVKEVEDIDEEN
jgi:sialate O-acetylesterase